MKGRSYLSAEGHSDGPESPERRELFKYLFFGACVLLEACAPRFPRGGFVADTSNNYPANTRSSSGPTGHHRREQYIGDSSFHYIRKDPSTGRIMEDRIFTGRGEAERRAAKEFIKLEKERIRDQERILRRKMRRNEIKRYPDWRHMDRELDRQEKELRILEKYIDDR